MGPRRGRGGGPVNDETWPGGYPGRPEVPNITESRLTQQQRREALAPFRARLFRFALRVIVFMLALLIFSVYETGVDPTSFAIVIPALAVAALWGALQFIDWETILLKPSGENLLGVSFGTLILAMGIVSTIPELRGVVFILYFGVVSFSAAIGGRLLQFFTTSVLLASHTLLPLALGESIPTDTLIVEIATLVLVAIVSSTVATEFRRETYAGISRVVEIQSREEDVNRLYEVSRTMSAGGRLQDVLPQLVGRIGTYLNAQVGVALLHDWESNSLTVLSPIWTSGERLVLEDYRVDLRERSDLANVFLSRQSKSFRDIEVDPKRHGLLGELGISSALAVPLTVENRTIGVMVLADKAVGQFLPRDLEVFESLAAPAALILAQLERYEEAAETSRRMEELAQMKTDFVSVVSHELRTPLTSIIGSLATIARPELMPESPAAQELLATARKQSDRLRRLIEDLLMVSRIDNDALPQHPERIEMASFVAEQVAGIPGATTVTTMVIEPDLVVEADPDHLSRVLRNLIENALKYATDSPIYVAAKARGSDAIVAVIDHGPGIPPDRIEHAFQAFSQIDPSVTRSQGGTGLGLSIVRSLLGAMGGEIDLSETEGGGATFTVRLPLRAGLTSKQSPSTPDLIEPLHAESSDLWG